MVKTFTISKKELRNRYQPTNIEVLEEQYAKGNNIILLGAHYANWEWIFSVNTRIKYNGVAVYTRINNKYFDNKKTETVVLRKVLRTKQLDDYQKEQKIRDIFNGS